MAEKKAHAAGVYRDCNIVAQERVWKEAVHRETSAARQWYELCQGIYICVYAISPFLNLQGRQVGLYCRV